MTLLAGVSAAQGSFHVSTTADVVAGGLAGIDDASLVTAGSGAGALPFFVEGHWQAVTGWVPSDVDAFGRRLDEPGGTAQSIVLSIQSNEGGFLDGDVLTPAEGGGLRVLISEQELLDVLGVPTANIDLDALDYGASGCLFFSLQSDLSGTVLGNLEDGDVLCYDPYWVSVGRILSEPMVQAKFTEATGSVASIGDVIAIEEDQGQLWIVPQSPSSYDGAVISVGSPAYVVADEDDMNLGGAELDALSVASALDAIPCFTLDVAAAAPGDPVQVSLHGAPNTIYVALMSGGTGWIDFAARPGFGAFYFDPLDPWLNTLLGQSGPRYAVTDSQGRFSASWTLPTGTVFGTGFQGEEGWSFQVFELPSLEVSAPFRLRKL